jgi:cytochrome o ubiquinol oxidase subunit III
MTEATVISITSPDQDARTIFGFWLYLMTDCILFATLFAGYAVLRNNTFGGPSGAELVNLKLALTQTLLLLTSSFTCGLGMLAARRGQTRGLVIGFALSFLLGASFVALEINEFAHMAMEGNSWKRSGFLTGFFSLVGTHGCHVTMGLLWMLMTLPQVMRKGLTSTNMRRLTCLSTYWHFLDIVWIFVFTVVYLMAFVN